MYHISLSDQWPLCHSTCVPCDMLLCACSLGYNRENLLAIATMYKQDTARPWTANLLTGNSVTTPVLAVNSWQEFHSLMKFQEYAGCQRSLYRDWSCGLTLHDSQISSLLSQVCSCGFDFKQRGWQWGSLLVLIFPKCSCQHPRGVVLMGSRCWCKGPSSFRQTCSWFCIMKSLVF